MLLVDVIDIHAFIVLFWNMHMLPIALFLFSCTLFKVKEFCSYKKNYLYLQRNIVFVFFKNNTDNQLDKMFYEKNYYLFSYVGSHNWHGTDSN